MKAKHKNRQYINIYLSNSQLFKILSRDFKRMLLRKRDKGGKVLN
jgi:hypothetical protein